MERPRRRVVLKLDLEADSWEDAERALHSLRTEIAMSGSLSKGCVSGGYSSGWHYTTSEDESITHDSWAAANDAYCATLKDTPAS